jgi:hypothetical protein
MTTRYLLKGKTVKNINKDFWWDMAMVALVLIVTVTNPTILGLVALGVVVGISIERYLIPWLARKIVQRRMRHAEG